MFYGERISDILEKHPPGYKIHAVHAGRATEEDKRELDEIEFSRLSDFLALMDETRIFAKKNGIPIVEVVELEDDYTARPGDYVVVVGCFGDMCVADHVVFLQEQGINAMKEDELCLVL